MALEFIDCYLTFAQPHFSLPITKLSMNYRLQYLLFGEPLRNGMNAMKILQPRVQRARCNNTV